jgi:hypothetical protein
VQRSHLAARRLRVGCLALAAAGAIAMAGMPGSVGRAAAASRPAHSGNALYWGAWIGTQFTGTEAPWDMRAVSAFQRLVNGKGLSMIALSSPFEDCYRKPCTSYSFPTAQFQKIRNYGAIPFFNWGSNAAPIQPNKSRYALKQVIAGRYDSYIRAWASAAARWRHPFFLRFDWEMNGKWYPWGWGANGNGPRDFVLAWRHVHDIFKSAGASNATWVWCPNVDPGGVFGPLQAMYPGGAYVDWTCLDVYNRATPWLSFDALFRSTYDVVETLAPTKPMVLAEVATTGRGGSKPDWISGLLTNLSQRYPNVRGILWFEKYASGFDWPIETSAASKRAFARAISSPLYVGSEFRSLPNGPIQPPR